jgi:hypothetical protein
MRYLQRAQRAQRGFQIVELVVTLWLLAVVGLLAGPPLLRLASGVRVWLAAEQVLTAMIRARSAAVRLGTNVAVKLRLKPGGGATWTLYRDGDGDGVLSKDIDKGVDPPLGPPELLEPFGHGVWLGFPPGPAPRDPASPDRRLSGLEDPIRFNSSDMASFGPLGTATPGSIYLTDGKSHLAAVRVFGLTGKMRVIVYDSAKEIWR